MRNFDVIANGNIKIHKIHPNWPNFLFTVKNTYLSLVVQVLKALFNIQTV